MSVSNLKGGFSDVDTLSLGRRHDETSMPFLEILWTSSLPIMMNGWDWRHTPKSITRYDSYFIFVYCSVTIVALDRRGLVSLPVCETGGPFP